jgi:hypothetical protein
VVHYQEHGTLGNITTKEILVAGAIGAAAGVVGGAILPAAAALGTAAAGAAATAGASTAVVSGIGIGTELASGVIMSGLSNVVLSNTQRASMDAIEGKDVSLGSIMSNAKENFRTDFSYGAISYGLARGATAFAKIWDPIEYNPKLVNPPDPTLLDPIRPNPLQKIIPSTLYVFATEIAANSTLLECATHKSSKCR